MLKLNTSFSRKIQGEGQFTSRGYLASVELELPDGLTQEQIRGRIRDAFGLVKNSVDDEIAKDGNGSAHGSVDSASASQEKKEALRALASPKQVKYLSDLAREKGMKAESLAMQKFGVGVYDLTKKECSDLIDELGVRRKAA